MAGSCEHSNVPSSGSIKFGLILEIVKEEPLHRVS
jgi:hypothetical protein